MAAKPGCSFLSAKLLDYRSREAALETDPNPFAAVVLAQLKPRETRGAPGERGRWKLRLVQGLYDRGFSAEQVGLNVRFCLLSSRLGSSACGAEGMMGLDGGPVTGRARKTYR